MTACFRSFVVLSLLAMLAVPLTPRAQDQSDGTLHIVRPSINAEQDLAEFCLELDHPLDLSDRNRIIAAIRLESGGKTAPVASSNISLAAESLCLQGLAHRQDYKITVTDLRGAAGEKLTEPYKLSFTIPDRHPSLAFAGDSSAGGLARMKDNDPVLRAINVAHAGVTLYRVTDSARMAEAYGQRMQTTLAPSESLTFAKSNGQIVWQGELTLDDSEDQESANQTLEHPVPLHAEIPALPPGLYFLVAADAEPPAKTKKVTADLAPLAAQWFIRSDLEIHALHKNDGFAVETENAGAPGIAKDVRLILFGRDQKTLTEGKSDAGGLGFLPLAGDQRGDATVIVGLSEAGDVDFADLSANETGAAENRFTLDGLEASLAADRPFYAPSAAIHLTLTARNIHGEAVAMSGSSVQLLCPDHSLYAVLPVPDGKAGVFDLSFPAPAVSGLWTAVWQQPDGRALAHIPLWVTSNGAAPRVTWSADRPMLTDDGDVVLSLKSVIQAGGPAPYVTGHILVQWTTPDTMAGWGDYHFGKGENVNKPPVSVAAFVTGADGNAQFHLNLKPPDDPAPLHTAVVSLRADPASGALDPDPLSLPVRPDNLVIGIKPLAPDGKFAEDSLARFDIVALDGDGKRREDASLKYQIYEEGRSFAWFQADGRWDYKPLQQRRRIGGGALDVKANGGNVIRWPVAAGAYTLEITDANGAALARFHFDAGWGLLKPNQTHPGDLTLVPGSTFVQPGIAAHIKFKLDHAAVISAVIADDQIRKIIYEAREAGDNDIVFTPEEAWGDRIRVRIEAEQKAGDGTAPLAGQIELPVRQQPKELTLAAEAPDHVAGGQELKLAVSVGNIAAHQPTFVSVLATPRGAGGNADVLPPSVLARDIEVDGGGKAVARLAVPPFSGTLDLKIIASNQNQTGKKESSIAVRKAFEADLAAPAVLQADDVARLALDLKNNDAPLGAYRYALNGGVGFKIAGAASGSANFAEGARKTVSFDLRPAEAGAHEVALDLTGPQGFHLSRSWPIAVLAAERGFNDVVTTQIAPQQSWTPPVAGKGHAKAKPEEIVLFVSPQPLFDAPQILPAFIEATPFTTSEIAGWLETMRLWREVTVKAGFLPAGVAEVRQEETLQQLLARQKPDGGFPSLPGDDADPASTADALVTLARLNQPPLKPAIDAAAGWLQQRLSNTWFDEAERPVRAAGFASLAAADRLDVAALRYFAETSEGKTLPPLAMAQLAFALAKNGDQNKAAPWLKALHDQLGTAPLALPAAAENPLVDPYDLLPALQKLSDDLVHHPANDPQLLAAFLCAVWVVDTRSGGWRVTVNGADKNQADVLVLPPSGKPALPVLRNPTDRPVYVTGGKEGGTAPPDSAITRRIYQPDGQGTAADQLRQNGIYAVVLEGPLPASAAKLLVHDAPGGGLMPLGCAVAGDAGATPEWAWLRNLSPTPVSACEANASGIAAVLTPPASGDKNTWRIVYLVRAGQAGNFGLAPAAARALPGNDRSAGGALRIDVK